MGPMGKGLRATVGRAWEPNIGTPWDEALDRPQDSWASSTPSPGAPGQAPSCVLGASLGLGVGPGSAGRRGPIPAAASRLGDGSTERGVIFMGQDSENK